MFKRGCLMGGIFVLVCLLGACNESESYDDDCNLDCNLVGGRPQTCVKINGTESCKDSCLVNSEGTNAAICYVNSSLDPLVAPHYSAVDTCAKDDNGKLYSAKTDMKECSNGCDETTGLCKSQDVPEQDAECEALQCDVMVGGLPHLCVTVSGQKSCKPICLGSSEGTNAAVCYVNSSLDPLVAPHYSAVDTCALDDNGKLYSDNADMKECSNGCDETTGLCKQQ